MRIDLCRTCGSEMKCFHKCEDCRRPISFICRGCRSITDTQYHLICDPDWRYYS